MPRCVSTIRVCFVGAVGVEGVITDEKRSKLLRSAVDEQVRNVLLLSLALVEASLSVPLFGIGLGPEGAAAARHPRDSYAFARNRQRPAFGITLYGEHPPGYRRHAADHAGRC